MPERFVKIDLTQDECDAVHEVCDLANVMLRDLAHSLPVKRREFLHAKINAVRYKMGVASQLFTGPTVIDTNPVSLEIAKRLSKGH